MSQSPCGKWFAVQARKHPPGVQTWAPGMGQARASGEDGHGRLACPSMSLREQSSWPGGSTAPGKIFSDSLGCKLERGRTASHPGSCHAQGRKALAGTGLTPVAVGNVERSTAEPEAPG